MINFVWKSVIFFPSHLICSLFQAAIYGMAQGIPDRSIVAEVACGFLDCVYNINTSQPQENGVHHN